MSINLRAANNKLLQAELLYEHLRLLPKEIARDMRRAATRDYRLPLETFFSACLSAARSSYYVLCESGGADFKPIESHWRNSSLDQEGRTRFNTMLKLRDDDIHYGETGAEALPKMMEVEMSELHIHHNAALFGPAAMAEHKNPDGLTVRAPGLQSTFSLYIDIGGSRVEATTACAGFIAQLRTLLQAAEAAVAAKAAATSNEAAAGA